MGWVGLGWVGLKKSTRVHVWSPVLTIFMLPNFQYLGHFVSNMFRMHIHCIAVTRMASFSCRKYCCARLFAGVFVCKQDIQNVMGGFSSILKNR